MAVAFDAKTSAWSASSTTTMLISGASGLTVGSGANRALVVCLMFGASGGGLPAGLTLVWDSVGANQSLIQIPGTLTNNGSTAASSAMYGLINPASGNKTLTISWTGNNEAHACGIAFTGVDQTSVAVAFPHGTNVNHTTSTASPTSVTVTSATGNMVVACHEQNVATFSAVNQTSLAIDNTGPNLAVAANYASGAATVALTGAFAGSGAWDAIGCDVLAAGGAAAIAAKKLIVNRQALVRAAHW